MNTDFRLKANGKLLISGEYLVMNGAKALAFPIRYGQEINIKSIPDHIINWKSIQNDQIWFTASFSLPDLSILTTSDTAIAFELKNILQHARNLNPEFLFTQCGFSIDIKADYPLKWGFGSSSTLIYLISRWACINEFSLYKKLTDGSAYDIACASQQRPIFYQMTDKMPKITLTEFGNGIKNHCIFAYLGNKQNSKDEIERYKKAEIPSQKLIDRISELSDEFCKATSASELIEITTEHEHIISSIIQKPVLAQQRFSEFRGSVKSLGAWGGDFAMFTADKSIDELREDLKQLGLTTLFSYDDFVIKY
jgi:mevalonate kinase